MSKSIQELAEAVALAKKKFDRIQQESAEKHTLYVESFRARSAAEEEVAAAEQALLQAAQALAT